MASTPAPQTERQRVDDYIAKKLAERRAAAKPAARKQYPLGVSAMGKGFENLYDALGGQPIEEKKK